MDLKKLTRKRAIYLGLLIAFVGLMLWAFISAGVITHNFKREQLIGKENHQQLDISGIILTETKDDKKYWEIYAENGYYSSDNKVAMLENVMGNFYDTHNEVSMSLESSRGTYNEIKKQIILYNNTHIVIKDGTSLYCDRLIWSGTDKDIVAEGNIKIIRNRELVSVAKKATISPDYADFKIIGKTVTKLYDLKEKK